MHKSWKEHGLRALQAGLLALSLVAMNLIPLTNALAQDAGDPAPSEPAVETLAPAGDPGIGDPGSGTEDPGTGSDPGPEGSDAGDGSIGGDEFGSEFRALLAPLVLDLIAEPDVTVYIYKYLDGPNGEASASGSGAPSFPMHAVWNATNIGSGNGDYPLDPPNYNTQTTNMSAHADYATNEITDGNPVLAAGAECEADKYRLVGYRYGDTLEDAENAAISTDSPSFTDLRSDQYVIVVNEDCDNPAPPPTPQSCTLVSDDEDTYVGSDPASEVTPHPVWTSAFSGDNATWVWDAPGSPDATVVFTRTFMSSNLNIGTLEVAADNSYSVTVNGDPVLCNGAGDNNFNPDFVTYGISGGPDTCTIPVLAGSNTIAFTVTNAGGAANPDAGNPAGLYYRITVPDSSCTDVAPEPPVQTSDVTLCKVSDAAEESSPGMPGWVLYLKGENLQTDLLVPSTNSSGVNSDPLVAGMNYLLNAFGIWTNQGSANPVDAEYSTTDGWTSHMDGYDGYGVGILELEVNQTDTNWGPYNGSHSYNQIFSPGASGPANFRIFDGDDHPNQREDWFGDNSGSLLVDIDEAYSGTTGQNGCVTLEDVPYGTYTAGEIAQEGWSLMNIRGGEYSGVDGNLVDVNSPTEYFTFVNHQGEAPLLKVHILKYLSNGETISPVTDDAELPEFPMTSTWQTPNLNGGVQTSGSYVLGNYHGGSPGKYGADTSPMEAPADYTTSETIDGSVVVAGENECSPGRYVLLGYKSGSTLEEAEASEISEEPIAYTDITSDRYIIVVNKPCDNGEPEEDMCVIDSDTMTLEGGDESFIATFIHESWTAIIAGAEWIWGDAAIVDPEGSETQTFTRGFALDSVPGAGGTLVIAADNTYSVSVNGNFVSVDPNEDNYTDGAKDTIPIPAAYLIAGNNTLEITVTNMALPNGTQETNPAGLKYQLTIDGSNCTEATPSFKVHVFKYLQDGEAMAQIPNDSDAPLFPMIAQYSIVGVGTNLDPGDGYVLGNGGGVGGSDDGLLWAANTRPMHAGDTYGTHEVTGGDSPVVSNPEACEEGKYLLLGYKTGDTLAEAQAAEISPDAPNYVGIANSKYVIVVNEDCGDVLNDGGGDGNATLTIVKESDGSEDTFNFNVDPVDEEAPAISDVSILTDGNGTGTSEPIPLPEGTYDVTEDIPEGWNLTDVTCIYDNESFGDVIIEPELVGETIDVDDGDDVTCTFTNTLETRVPTTGTLVVQKVIVNDNGNIATPSDFFFQVNGGGATAFEEDGANQLELAPGTYTVTEVAAGGYTTSYENCSEVNVVVGETATCTVTNDDEPASSNNNGGGGGGGGSNNSSGSVLGASTDEGQVLGNECTLLTDFMREGMANNPGQVTLLQAFLNGEMGSGLPTTGFFGLLTTAAVNSFQLRYWEEVLKPWADIGMGQEHTPTGFVYKTTLWKINDIKCPDLDAPFPTLP